MTDKEKIRAEIERLRQKVMGVRTDFADGQKGVLTELLSFIDSMQEEQEHFLEDAPATDYEVPKIEAWLAREDETDTQLGYLYLYLHKPVRAEDAGQWIGHNGVIVWNEGKYKALKWEDEPLKVSLSILGDKPKKCMFTKEEFTEEDRKILCEDCEEECEYAKKEEPVSEDLEEVAKRYATEGDEISGLYIIDEEVEAFKAGAKWQKEKDFQYIKKECERVGSCCDDDIAIEAQRRHPYYYTSDIEAYANIGFKEGATWQKEQMMAKAVEVTVHVDAGNYPYIPQIELYDYNKDVPLAKEGDKYKVVLIKEE